MSERHRCALCSKEWESRSSLFRHLRAHGVTAERYVLENELDSITPTCACGCGQETAWHVARKGFNEFVHGHHKKGAEVTLETREKIARTNRANMKEWWAKQPEEVRQKRSEQLRSGITPEVERRRLERTREAYDSMTEEDKKKFSEHSKKLWSESRDIMEAGRAKAAETWLKRYENGEYDFEERDRKISEKITQLYIEGGFQWARGTYEPIKCSSPCHYRSSWELELMRKLDDDEEVISWEYEPISISYTIDGVERRYIPDFIVNTAGGTLMIEVKPATLSDTSVNAAKREAAMAYCDEFGFSYREWELINDAQVS